MTTRRPIVAGNWKMNGMRSDGPPLAYAVAELFKKAGEVNCEVVLCPPFTLLGEVATALKKTGVSLGAQDCHPVEKGAHTGDISALMLKDFGCAYVISGHSERRTNHKETDVVVRSKVKAITGKGMKAILCIGETEAERTDGKTKDVCARQLQESIPDGMTAEDLVIAYEPVWAIGTGKTPTAAEVQETHAFIRKELGKHLSSAEADKVRILYGGSVKPSNAEELMSLPDVDGALVGGASLVAKDFWAIVEAKI